MSTKQGIKLLSIHPFTEWKLSLIDRTTGTLVRTVWTRKGASPPLRGGEGVDSAETSYYGVSEDGNWYRVRSPIPVAEIKEVVSKESA